MASLPRPFQFRCIFWVRARRHGPRALSLFGRAHPHTVPRRQSRLARECFGEYGPGIAPLLAQTKIRSPRTSRRFAGKLPRVAVCTSKPRACSPWHSAGLFRAMEGKPESVGMTFVTRGRRRRCPTLPPDLPRDQCATSRVPCLWSAYWATHPECCLLALAKTGW